MKKITILLITITSTTVSFGQNSKLSKIERAKKAYEFTYRADKSAEDGNLNTGIKLIDSAIFYLPEDPTGYYNRGSFKIQLGDFKGAINDFNIAIKLNPNLGEAYYNRAVAYSNLGILKNACDDLHKAKDHKFDVTPDMIKTVCK